MKELSAMNIYSKKNPPSGFYVYAYIRKNGTPYYIGKGSGKRAWAKSDRTVFSASDFSNVVILEHNLTDIGALAIERRMIRWYGRIDNGTGILRNKTDGGDGNAGWVMPTEVKEKISESNKGRMRGYKFSDEQLKNRTGSKHWNYNKTTPKDVSKKISVGVKRRNQERIIKVKDYTLLDTYTNETINFNLHTFDEKVSPLGISRSGLFWAVRYNSNRLYKNRFTLI
jgi:hypothetical protein